MAQFGKHLFGTSLFGKSNSFIGTYDSRVVDAGKPFTGAIDISLIYDMPHAFYPHNEKLMVYKGDVTPRAGYTELNKGATVSSYISGKNLSIEFGIGEATIEVMEQDTQEVRSYTANGQNNISLDNFPNYEMNNYIITITANTKFEFKGIKAQTTDIKAWVRATTEEHGRSDYFLKGDWPLITSSSQEEEHGQTWIYSDDIDFREKGERLVGQTPSFENVRYIQVKIILMSADSETTPVVDDIYLSSGDLSKYRSSGIWQCALDMNNIAADENVEFQRVKRLEWIETQEEMSPFDIHSSSRNSTTPSVLNIMDDSYWSDLTAKYVLNHNGRTLGVPNNRVSLNERNNGYSESARFGSLMFGPINPMVFGFIDTVIGNWQDISGQIYYPRNSNSARIYLEFYENKDDIDNGVPALFILEDPKLNRANLIDISNRYNSLYVRLILERGTSFSTAVVDQLDINMLMNYRSARNKNNYMDILSPLDGYEENNSIGEGRRLVKTLSLNSFDWPSRSQGLPENINSILDSEKRLEIDYNPKYINQVHLGIESPDDKELVFTNEYPENFKIHSQVYAEEPLAAMTDVDRNKLYWHYSYDGSTVNFPLQTKRPLTTQYTPSLLNSKKYRFMIRDGWRDETFKVPYPMTFEDIANITLYDVDRIKEVNENTPLYGNNILTGYDIRLPNDSINPNVHVEFEITNNKISNNSLLNDKPNDTIVAWVSESEFFKYLEWTSDEVVFNGLINYNDEQLPYIRTQNSSHNVAQRGKHTVALERETAYEIARRYNIDPEDLIIANGKREVFSRNEEVVVPGGYSLPDIAPGLIYEGDHPYVIEIIPGTVKRTKGNVRLPNNSLIAGAEDEPPIQYTLTESNVETLLIKRGSITNGRDRLPVSNVIKINKIANHKTGHVYSPATTSMGDYDYNDGHIDWSPVFSDSKEPNEGEYYSVTFTRGVIDTLRIVYTSDYIERMSQDRMRAIPVMSKDYQIDLRNDYIVDLPDLSEVQREHPDLKNIRYIAENSDLWVNNTIEDNKIRLSLNGEDPNINWYPAINTGFYYLNDQEHYLYSRPVQTVYGDNDIPVIRDIEYTSRGIRAIKE